MLGLTLLDLRWREAVRAGVQTTEDLVDVEGLDVHVRSRSRGLGDCLATFGAAPCAGREAHGGKRSLAEAFETVEQSPTH
jgi:hypothetical protein